MGLLKYTSENAQRRDEMWSTVTGSLQECIKNGRHPVLLYPRSKLPVMKDWANAQVDASDFQHDSNIGVALGNKSNGLVDVDLDCDEARRLAHMLPPTDLVFGRESKEPGHYIYHVKNAKKTIQHGCDGMIAELRGNGGQTMFPPSVHENGDKVVYTKNGKPGETTWEELEACVAKLAAAALLSQHWPETGSRQRAALALSGMLLQAGWEKEEVEDFISNVALASNDEEVDMRAETAASTVRKLEEGEPTTGAPTLATLVGEDVVKTVKKWLKIKSARAASSEFIENDGCTYVLKNGREKIANFTARIVCEENREGDKVFNIEAIVGGSKRFAVVAAKDYASMDWVPRQLGADATIMPRKKDDMRAAIQMFSQGCPKVRCFTTTGWHKIDGWAFVHAAGAIGGAANVELLPELSKVRLPAAAGGFAAVERFTKNIPPKLSLPLLAAVARTTIGSCHLNIELVGMKRTFKTETAKLVQSFYGPLQEDEGLPGSWMSTGNSLELLAHQAKDIILVVDDYSGGFDQLRGEGERERLLRGNFNGQGRSRLTKEGEYVAARAPQCTLLSTAERSPTKASVLDRTFTIEVHPGDIDAGKLTECQIDSRSGEYAAFTSGYIQWLLPQLDQIRERVALREMEIRGELMKSGNPRGASIDAKLISGMEVMDRYFVEQGGEGYAEKLRIVLKELRGVQEEVIQETDPIQAFEHGLSQALRSGSAHLATLEGGVPKLKMEQLVSIGWRLDGDTRRPGGTRVGFVEERDLYLLPGPALEAAAKQVSNVPTQRQLSSELKRRGMLKATENGRGATKRIQIDDRRPGTWQLDLSWLLPEDGAAQ